MLQPHLVKQFKKIKQRSSFYNNKINNNHNNKNKTNNSNYWIKNSNNNYYHNNNLRPQFNYLLMKFIVHKKLIYMKLQLHLPYQRSLNYMLVKS